MSINTNIEWTDSTLNLQMGCDGCELWNPKIDLKKCYAGVLTERWGGGKGWPTSFDQPKIFPHRLNTLLSWPDLTGKERPDKPWLNGYPRTVFLNDMGDTFTESLPLDWLAEYVPQLAESPHIYQILTKRPARMVKFFEQLGYIPDNFWLMTSVTDQSTVSRVRTLLKLRKINPGVVLGLSVEPLLGPVDFEDYAYEAAGPDWAGYNPLVDWVIIGGESGHNARPMSIKWASNIVFECQTAGVPVFVKQLGSNPAKRILEPLKVGDWQNKKPIVTPLKLKDKKGGDSNEWPPELQIREMPAIEGIKLPS